MLYARLGGPYKVGFVILLSTEEEYKQGQNEWKEEILMAIREEIGELKAAVVDAVTRVETKLGNLEALRAEKDALVQQAAELLAAEDAEDVDQNAEIARLREELAAKDAEIADASADVLATIDEVKKIGADAAEPEAPVV